MDLRLFLSFSVLGTCLSYIPKSTVQKLYANLMKDYEPSIKPVYDQSSEINVYAFLNTATLFDLDIAAQTMSIMTYFTITWTDHFLVWNATEYDGLDFLVFRYTDIWHPSLQIGLSADGQTTFEKGSDRVMVFSNGTVIWSPGEIISVLCPVEITFYPFDTQECSIFFFVPFTSWSEQELVTFPAEPSKELMEGHPEWHLLDLRSVITREYGEASIVYTFLYRRRSSFIVFTTIVPLVLLSILNACVILVPVSSGEKGSIAVTLFLSYCVYLTTIGTTLPSNSIKISLLVLYMTIVQIFSGLTMLYSIFETSAYIHGGHKWLLHCVGCVSRSNNYTDKRKEVKDGDNSQSQEQCNEQLLNSFRRLDHVVFVILFLSNVTVIIFLTVETVNSLREKIN